MRNGRSLAGSTATTNRAALGNGPGTALAARASCRNSARRRCLHPSHPSKKRMSRGCSSAPPRTARSRALGVTITKSTVAPGRQRVPELAQVSVPWAEEHSPAIFERGQSSHLPGELEQPAQPAGSGHDAADQEQTEREQGDPASHGRHTIVLARLRCRSLERKEWVFLRKEPARACSGSNCPRG